MKRILLWMLILMMALGAVSAAAQPLVGKAAKPGIQMQLQVNGQWKSPDKITLEVNDRIPYRTKLIGLPEDTLIWLSSQDKTVAQVDGEYDEWYLYAYEEGQTVISIEQKDLGLRDQIKVTVVPAKADKITLPRKTYKLELGNTLDIGSQVRLNPSYVETVSYTFSSSNKKVATVDENGLVTPLKTGKTRITVKLEGSKKIKTSCTIQVVKAKEDPEETWRFFGIGQFRYSDHMLSGTYYDVRNMAAAYRNGKGVKAEDVHIYNDLTSKGILGVLEDMVDSGADETDVTVFYYAGHGVYSKKDVQEMGALYGVDGKNVTVNTVQSYLDRVPGRVIVILDSCFSGQFIREEEVDLDTLKAFSQKWIISLAGSKAKNFKALPDSPVAGKYTIITAAQPDEYSNGDWPSGVFTRFVSEGLGVNYKTGKKTALKADANKDNTVTLDELYRYVEKNVSDYFSGFPTQNTMAWPLNSGHGLLVR